MALKMLDVKFLCGTQLTFKSFNFATGEDGDLKMLPPGSAPEHTSLASLSASGGSCSGSDPCAVSYIRIAKIIWGVSVVTSILQPLVRALSSSSSAFTPNPNSSDDYPKIGASAYVKPAEGGHLICMVAPNGDRSNNTSSRYSAIRRSEASDV
jgi:hypothetical protein